ncbi:hypothetical protein IVB43_23670 [Bradyrhizobium sp. 48]|uniref:hypothetical protein n=1 Tax=Bradyrhizobium sp. 48 TaxID=2782676 RepID=UPI001FFBA68E|nr:hypothetical protein [Bradyrhizobium sp. 48]MCK1445387.1 hypothetical protein [Bradyrhizobium sp. 48]
MGETAAERLHDAVNRHNIAWTDLTMRVAGSEGISRDAAAEQVLGLIERRSVTMPVAIALIDMIVERTSKTQLIEPPKKDPIIAAVASLTAAISLLEHTPKAKKAAPSDKMFEQMLSDYRKDLANARAILALTSNHNHGEN